MGTVFAPNLAVAFLRSFRRHFADWLLSDHWLVTRFAPPWSFAIDAEELQRFLDDFFSVWVREPSEFWALVASMNIFSRLHGWGIQFSATLGKAGEPLSFLDVQVCEHDGMWHTSIFLKLVFNSCLPASPLVPPWPGFPSNPKRPRRPPQALLQFTRRRLHHSRWRPVSWLPLRHPSFQILL